MVAIDRERLISEKRNNKASAEGTRLPKEAMLSRDIFKFTKPSLDAFRPLGLINRAFQEPRNLPNSINVDFKKNLTQSTRLTCRLLLTRFVLTLLLIVQVWTKTDSLT